MYGCSTPILIYGWIENNSNKMINPDWIAKHYKNVNIYANEVVRNHMYSACYGIECKISNNGTIVINETNKEEVTKIYNVWRKYYEKKNVNICALGYYMAICGDYDYEHEYYTPVFP
jgi:hypothetical protein